MGMIASRVKHPINTKKPQTNSAKITRIKDSIEPMPITSWNIGSISLNDTSLE
jgi:hypothetical protein